MSKASSSLWLPRLPVRSFTWGDVVVCLMVSVLVYLGVRLAIGAPIALKGPEISLSLAVLPWYALLSIDPVLPAYRGCPTRPVLVLASIIHESPMNRWCED